MEKAKMEQPSVSNAKANTTVFNIKYNADESEIEFVQQDAVKDEEQLSNSDVYIIKQLEPRKYASKYECEICGRFIATSLPLWQKHMKTCKQNDKIIGESCEELSIEEINSLQKSTKELEKKHICYCCEENLETAHTGHIRCQDCPKSFKTVPSYRRHVSFVHSSAPTALPCPTCNAKCPTQWILQIHLEAHKKGKQFACQKCGKEFTRRYHLIRHEQFSNCDASKKQPPKSCNICGKEFFRIDNLRTHLRQHIGEQVKTREYNCPYCQKSFVGTTTLNIHIRTHTGEKPFLCDVCKKGFPSNGALRKHRRSHTGEKPFKCEECQRCFAAKEVLNRHMKTHTGVRPHVCEVCGKAFIQATQLSTHMFHHTGESAFSCVQCHFSFSRKKRLTDHATDYHSGDVNVFDCLPCLMCFDNKSELVSHMQLHLNEKLYKCQACEGKFFNKSLHLKCFSCKICNSNSTKVHQHISEFASIKLVQKKKPTVINQSNSETSQSGKPRKLKILTSKPKKQENSNNKTIEVIIVKKPDSLPEITAGCDTTNSNENAEILAVDVEMEANMNSVSAKDERISRKSPEAGFLIEELETEIMLDEQSKKSKCRMDDSTLNESIGKLLNLLLDAELLRKFGWPSASIEHVLSSVIQQCGHKPADYDTCPDYSTKIRENAKLLFTFVVDNDSFKELLNNFTIDEVIQQILKMTN